MPDFDSLTAKLNARYEETEAEFRAAEEAGDEATAARLDARLKKIEDALSVVDMERADPAAHGYPYPR